jgi:hypothetical protein
VSERLIQNPQDLEAWDQKAMKKLLSTKFEHWKYEDELRVFISIDEKDVDGLFFVPFSENLIPKEVVLGVRCEVAETCIHELARDLMQPVEIIKARLDFRSFSVVK